MYKIISQSAFQISALLFLMGCRAPGIESLDRASEVESRFLYSNVIRYAVSDFESRGSDLSRFTISVRREDEALYVVFMPRSVNGNLLIAPGTGTSASGLHPVRYEFSIDGDFIEINGMR